MRESTLAVPLLLRKMFVQHRLELAAFELVHVVMVVAAAFTGIHGLVGGRENQRSVRRQHPPEFREHRYRNSHIRFSLTFQQSFGGTGAAKPASQDPWTKCRFGLAA